MGSAEFMEQAALGRVSETVERLDRQVDGLLADQRDLKAAARKVLDAWDDKLTTAGEWADRMEAVMAELRNEVAR